MSGIKWAALVFVFVSLTTVERGEANQSLDRMTFNFATNDLTYIDFDNSVNVQRYPYNNPGGVDYQASRPSLSSVQLVDFGSLPSSLALLLAGIIGLVLVRYRT